METLSTLLAICAGNSPVPGEIPAQRPVTLSFDAFLKKINGWVNTGGAVDLRRHPAYYDVIVMDVAFYARDTVLLWCGEFPPK